MSIEIVKGDLLESKMQTLVNATNCIGVMGAGIALAFKEKYPAMFFDYQIRCNEEREQVGFPSLWIDPDGGDKQIINFPTMHDPGQWAKLDEIEMGLDYIVRHLKPWRIQSIAFPALGCGIGGLEFYEVEKRIREQFDGSDIQVEIYAPLK